MKKIYKIFFTSFIIFAFVTIYAQVNEPSTGSVPCSFTGERTKGTIVPDGIIAYGYSSIQDGTVSMPIPGGTPLTFMQPWVPPDFASSMVKGPDGNYYITDISKTLYQFDPATGAINTLGSITGMGSYDLNGISYNPADGNYYLISNFELYSFDVSTRVATYLGYLDTGGRMIDLCFDAAGTCYAYDIVQDCAYTINLTTGKATFLGALGYYANYGQGMSYDFETGTIYLSAFNISTYTGQLRTMNPANGYTTLIIDWGFEQIAPFQIITNVVPVELTSFTANVNKNTVALNWTTATELNNQGFEIERSQKSLINGYNKWEKIGYVPGFGTTTEPKSYLFTDENLSTGEYIYRLRQIDFDGMFEYSDEVEVFVEIPAKFYLSQNYPNPFNPTTVIKYSVPEAGVVTLNVYNAIGQKITELANSQVEAGSYEVEFNASDLSSGIYFYQINAGNYSDIKKMILIH